MAAVVATVVAGRTVRLSDSRTFSPGKTFNVFAGAELPDPRGAADVEMSQEIQDLKDNGYITSAALPVEVAGADKTSLDTNVYFQEIRKRLDLGLIALGCYPISGVQNGAQGATATVKVCFMIPFDGLLLGFSGCAQATTGVPTIGVEVAGSPTTPATVAFGAAGTPVRVDLTTPLPVTKGQKLEFLLVTAGGEDLADVGVVADLVCRQVIHQTDPADQVDTLDAETGSAPVVRGAKTYTPIPQPV